MEMDTSQRSLWCVNVTLSERPNFCLSEVAPSLTQVATGFMEPLGISTPLG